MPGKYENRNWKLATYPLNFEFLVSIFDFPISNFYFVVSSFKFRFFLTPGT